MTSQTVLITGANRGIGLALTERFAARGDTVIAGCRDPESATALKALGPDVVPVQLDVADPASIAALAEVLRGRRLDGLVNNAGVFPGRGIRVGGQPLDFSGFDEAMAINAAGPLRVLEALRPSLLKGQGRKVITISSQMGSIERSPGGSYWYRASKAAVNSLMRNAARDLMGEGLILLLVHPGWVQTDMGGSAADIPVAESADGIIKLYDQMTVDQTGAFVTYAGEPHLF